MLDLDRRTKIKFINYWHDYKVERERLIDVGIQLWRMKFLCKRLIVLTKLSKLAAQVNLAMRACRVKHLYRNSQMFLSLKFYMLHKRMCRRHGCVFAERLRKRLIKPQLTIFGRAVYKSFSKKSVEVLAAFFNCID